MHQDKLNPISLKFRIKDSLVHLAVCWLLNAFIVTPPEKRFHAIGQGPYRIWFQFFKHVIALRGNRFRSQTPRRWTSGGERTDFTTICPNEHTSVHPSLHGQEERWPALSLWSPSSVRDKVYMKSTLCLNKPWPCCVLFISCVLLQIQTLSSVITFSVSERTFSPHVTIGHVCGGKIILHKTWSPDSQHCKMLINTWIFIKQNHLYMNKTCFTISQ